jgi:hypothetical protein
MTCEPLPRRNEYGSYIYRGVKIYRDGAARRFEVAYGRSRAGVRIYRTFATLRQACAWIDGAYLSGVIDNA